MYCLFSLLLLSSKSLTWIFPYVEPIFMVTGFQYIISVPAESTLPAAIDKKKTTIPLADDGKSFDSCIDAVRVMVPIESSVITSVVPCCISFAGCGVCKRMQPIFQQAATETKGKYVSLLNLALPHTQSTVLLHHQSDLQLSSSVMFAD